MAEVVSREKDLEKEIIFSAIEAALATATKKWHTEDIDARVSIHRDSGDYDSYRVWEVIDDDAELEFPDRHVPPVLHDEHAVADHLAPPHSLPFVVAQNSDR